MRVPYFYGRAPQPPRTFAALGLGTPLRLPAKLLPSSSSVSLQQWCVVGSGGRGGGGGARQEQRRWLELQSSCRAWCKRRDGRVPGARLRKAEARHQRNGLRGNNDGLALTWYQCLRAANNQPSCPSCALAPLLTSMLG